jgi:hypothetical protein
MSNKIFIKSVLKNRIILSLGTKGSGKTYLMLQFLRYCFKNELYEHYILCLPAFTIEQNDSYGFINEKDPNIYIFEGYDEFITAELIKQQENKKKQKKTLFVIDDASGEMIWNIDPFMRKLITSVRHYNVSLWFLAHATSKIISPFFRANLDIMLLSRVTSFKLLENIYDEYLSLTREYESRDGKKEFVTDFIRSCKEEFFVYYIDLRENVLDKKAANWKFV